MRNLRQHYYPDTVAAAAATHFAPTMISSSCAAADYLTATQGTAGKAATAAGGPTFTAAVEKAPLLYLSTTE